MTNDLPLSMEMVVVQAIGAAPRSREDWEAERGGEAGPMSDREVFLENVTEIVRRHGVVIAQLAVAPATRTELQARMPSAVERIPAWMEAKVYGQPLMTTRLFVRGLAQLMGEHRAAIERVVAEQVCEPGAIEASLAAAPLPAAAEDESDSELVAALGEAIGAHLSALVHIARDLDERLVALLNPH